MLQHVSVHVRSGLQPVLKFGSLSGAAAADIDNDFHCEMWVRGGLLNTVLWNVLQSTYI